MQIRRVGLMVLLGAVVAAGALFVYPRAETQAVAQFSSKGKPVRPQLTRLQVDLFELRCSREQLMKLDLMTLARGEGGPMKATAEQVLAGLRQLGEASLAVRYDNFADFTAGAQLSTGKSVPAVDNVSIGASGVVVPSVKYQDVGFNVRIMGNWLDETEPNLARAEFVVTRSGYVNEKMDAGYVAKDAKLMLPVYNQFTSQQHVVLRQGLPVLLACNNLAGVEDEKGLPILIARLVATRLIE